MILNCKQKSILFCLLSFVWVWFGIFVGGENFISPLTEPSSQAMRMTGTSGVSVVGGGNSTTFNIVKDRAQFFADKPIMGAKVPQTPVVTTTMHGGSSTLGGGNVTTSSSSTATRGLGGGGLRSEQQSLFWGKWSDYEKIIIDGKEYAKIGERYYTRHAVDRMQPSTLGHPVGVGRDEGRSFPVTFVEEVISKGKQQIIYKDGVERIIHKSGTAEVITENSGKIVITVNPFRGNK